MYLAVLLQAEKNKSAPADNPLGSPKLGSVSFPVSKRGFE
jgi:hypothetical protein